MTSYKSIASMSKYDVTIASSETISTIADLYEMTLTAIKIPASMTGTSITFLGSDDGITFIPIHDTTNTIRTLTIGTAACFITVNPSDYAGIRYLKVVSGSSEASERSISLYGVKATGGN